MIKITHAICFECLHNLHDPCRQWKRHIYLMGGFQNIGKILDMQIDSKARIKFTIHHEGRFGIEHCTSS